MNFLIVLLVAGFVGGQSWAAKKNDSFKVTKSELTKEMEIQVSNQLCNKSQMFADCYGWSKVICEKNVKINLKTCTGSRLTKKVYDLIDDGPKIYENIGSCLESRIRKHHKASGANCKQYTKYLM